MRNLDIYHGYWLLGRVAKNLGVWGLLGVAFIFSSFLFYMIKVTAVEREIDITQFELKQIQNKPVLVQPKIVSEQTTVQEASKFYSMFPSGASLPKWLGLIDETALKQHLILNRGDYKLSQTKQGQLSRYELVLPVAGKYTQIRQFIVEVLQKLPALALSDLQIKRENTLSPTVEARLVFVLFLQSDSW